MELIDVQFDIVVTVCGHADEHCPSFRGAPRVIHVDFNDSPTLAKDAEDEEEALSHFRRIRDEICEFVLGLPNNVHS